MVDEPTVKVRPGGDQFFLRKARGFARSMELTLAAGEFNGAASAASHCVISAADALLAKTKGVRSRARDHGAVVRLVGRSGAAGAREKAAQMEGVLSLKHVAEYDDRDVSPKEAQEAVLKARRFLGWVEARLNE
ncbi:MAG TPA: HEPN domain-containing protein [Candidatus Thermoplasmatota archaeon]|nr:HEPN domain-containing protein [Candidatus Thermoplasmatota archaeon]